jgi:S1-C subfamily serine protease
MSDMVGSSVQIGKYCSGTVIQDPDMSDGEQTTILSAKHCLEDGQTVGSVIEVNIPRVVGNVYMGDIKMKVIVKDVSKKSDLILLQAMKQGEGLDLPKVSVYNGLPQYGQDVWAVGYPAGELRTVTDGLLGLIQKIYYVGTTTCVFDSISCDYQKSTAPIYPGSSGGGLFILSDDGYELIGVLTGMDIRMSFAAFYTPLPEIQEFLNENVKG